MPRQEATLFKPIKRNRRLKPVTDFNPRNDFEDAPFIKSVTTAFAENFLTEEDEVPEGHIQQYDLPGWTSDVEIMQQIIETYQLDDFSHISMPLYYWYKLHEEHYYDPDQGMLIYGEKSESNLRKNITFRKNINGVVMPITSYCLDDGWVFDTYPDLRLIRDMPIIFQRLRGSADNVLYFIEDHIYESR